MGNNVISIINGTEIITVEQDGEIFVPIRPICDALDIDFSAQYINIQSDESLNSTIAIIATVATDGKTRDMVCLPLKFIYGWLFTINPGKVARESRSAFLRYHRECYDVLYKHFTVSMVRTIETNKTEISLLSQINRAITEEKEAKAQRRKLEQSLHKLRNERLNPLTILF